MGVRNGPTIVPLEIAGNLMERATPALAKRIALGYAKHNSRSLVEDMLADLRTPPSRTTVERIAKKLGTRAEDAVLEIENHLRKHEVSPAKARSIVIGLDRTSVPMEELRDEWKPPKTRRKTRTEPYVRRQPKPVDVNYRMAYVGTVSHVDKDGEVLHTNKYYSNASSPPFDLVIRMILDARQAKKSAQRHLHVVVIQDGAAELWKLFRAALDSLNENIPADEQVLLKPGIAMKALVLNVLGGRTPLYHVEDWAKTIPRE
ncbi:MAG: DUF4277 domain-containing protein, partial [Deltaproteobacteria bacterium]|nr:DUF4277 domain-containing protein [Deltaproteobacteria bacterium]